MFLLLAFAAISIVILFLKISNIIPSSRDPEPSYSEAQKIPSALKSNDKIIVIENVSSRQMQEALTYFCKEYNQATSGILPRLWQLSPSRFAVTFPHDIDFMTFCFAINFLEYPTNIKWTAQVTAWATIKQGDTNRGEALNNKLVMLYIPADDTEYDEVFWTTQDNVGYKMSFAGSSTPKQLAEPKMMFVLPSVNIKKLDGSDYQDFR